MTRKNDLTIRFVHPGGLGERVEPLSQPAKDSIQVFREALRERGCSYADYLRSTHWRYIVGLYKDDRCSICGRKDGLELHHRHYGYLGREWADKRCLVTVCRRHHEQIHGYAKRRGCTIAEATNVVEASKANAPSRKSRARRASLGFDKAWGAEQLAQARIERRT